MAKFIGRRAAIGIGKESSRGTAVAPTYWIPAASIGFADKVERVVQEAGFGQIADADSSYTVKLFGEGEVEADIHENWIGLVLAALAGAAPSSSGGPTNYVHTYTLQNINNKLSLSIAYHDPNQNVIFPFGMIDSLKIEVKPASIARATVAFRSQKSKDWATLTPSYTNLGNKYLSRHCEFRLADTGAAYSSNIDAASKITLVSLTLTVNNNLADWDTLGTVTPSDIVNRQFSVDGEAELAFEDLTYRNYVVDGTYKACGIKFNYGTNNYLDIKMPKVDIRKWEPSLDLDEVATQKFTFKALYDTDNAVNQIGVLTLANQVASY